MSRNTPQRNLLIVCEGEVTEPFYFRILADKAIEAGMWDSVKIIPEPRSTDAENDEIPTRKAKRALKNPETNVPNRWIQAADNTELAYLKKDKWQTPVNFVKEARDYLTDGLYSEAWVVFDRNGHPAHEAAFALAAEKDKPVHIAFSSRSFEHWVLLHFERNLSAFQATECKDEKKKPLGCGTDKTLAGGCQGDKCLSGYIRKNYLPNYSKKGDSIQLFKQLTSQNSLDNACINAAWLRSKQTDLLRGHSNKPFLINPYTTVDVLVKRLLGSQDNIQWVDYESIIELPKMTLVFEHLKNNQLNIRFTSKQPHTFLLNSNNLSSLIYATYQNQRIELSLEKTVVLQAYETKTCLIQTPNHLEFGALIHFQMDNEHLILEFPHV